MDPMLAQQIADTLGNMTQGHRCSQCDCLLVINGRVLNDHAWILSQHGIVIRICRDHALSKLMFGPTSNRDHIALPVGMAQCAMITADHNVE